MKNSNAPRKILPVWQPEGRSTYQITTNLAKKFGMKTAHTGVLDPLAEGVIIVLFDEERLKKIEYSKWKKTYEFEIIFGISTDSYDGMGLITQINLNNTNLKFIQKELKITLETFVGEYKQAVPLYSAVKVGGKKLFMYLKNSLPIPEIPTKTGYIYKIKLLRTSEVKLASLIKKIIERVESIKHGEFRQDTIVKRWKQYLSVVKPSTKVQIAKIYVETSSGMYVRSLSQDIAKKLGTVGFVNKIVRIKNGKYEKSDCSNYLKLMAE